MSNVYKTLLDVCFICHRRLARFNCGASAIEWIARQVCVLNAHHCLITLASSSCLRQCEVSFTKWNNISDVSARVFVCARRLQWLYSVPCGCKTHGDKTSNVLLAVYFLSFYLLFFVRARAITPEWTSLILRDLRDCSRATDSAVFCLHGWCCWMTPHLWTMPVQHTQHAVILQHFRVVWMQRSRNFTQAICAWAYRL